jgi:hypothetical protein
MTNPADSCRHVVEFFPQLSLLWGSHLTVMPVRPGDRGRAVREVDEGVAGASQTRRLGQTDRADGKGGAIKRL